MCIQQPLFELIHGTKHFGETVVLDDISLTLERGKAYCLIGYNGPGKNMQAKLVSGEQTLDSGTLRFEGKTYEEWNTVLAVSLGVVMISEYSGLFPGETLYQNMQHSLSGSRRFSLFTQRKRLINEITAFANRYGLNMQPNDLVGEMNNPDRVLFEFLRAKLLGVKLLVVDEIDTALGKRHKEVIKDILSDFKAQGVSILYISHKLDMVLSLADYIGFIRYNKLIPFELSSNFSEKEIAEIIFENSAERTPKLHSRKGEELFSLRHRDKPDEFCISVHEGEIVGVVGSGLRDSNRFYRMLFGGETEITIGKRKIKKLKPQSALENGIIYLSSASLHEWVFTGGSVCRNMLPFNVVKRERSKLQQDIICQRYINILNIKATPSSPIESLSEGDLRKVFLARSILSKVEVFIFENLTDSIDCISKIDIYNIINELKTRGKGILFLCSDIKEVIGISDSIIAIKDGKITGSFKNHRLNVQKLKECLEQEGLECNVMQET